MNKKSIYILAAFFSFIACQEIEIDETKADAPVRAIDSEISSVCMVSNVTDNDGPGKPMTKSLIGKETAVSLFGNFLKVEESAPQEWSLESEYDMSFTTMPSFANSQIVDAEVIASADNTENYNFRTINFNPRLVYKYTPKEGSLEPEIAYRTKMVGWYPQTYDVPEGLGPEDAMAQFSASGCMKIVDGKVCVEFKNKLDGQTDLMVTDVREGRMYKTGFKHNTMGVDYDIQPYGHTTNNPLNPTDFEYLNYFTFHHYLSAIRVFIYSEVDQSYFGWNFLKNVKVLDQPKTVTIALPQEQARGESVDGITATLPSEGVLPIFGEPVSWEDNADFNIIRTPMFVNNAADPSYEQNSSLPIEFSGIGALPETYLGYALVQPGRSTTLQLLTDVGVYNIPIKDADTILQPGMIYDILINVNDINGLEVVVRNDDEEKYQDLAPYNDQIKDYEYSNCYVITAEDIQINESNNYDGFFFRPYVPGRGPKGDIEGDPYDANSTLDIHSVRLLWQDAEQPIEHVELVQGFIRIRLDSRTTADNIKSGNAIIAAYNKDSNIVWTWHIWVCDSINDVTISGVTFLDRNIGAVWAPSSQDQVNSGEEALKTYGLYYQWGRKDPSPGPMSYNYDIIDMRTATYYAFDAVRNDVSLVTMVGDAPTIADGVANPSVILAPCNVGKEYSNDWLLDKNDDLWGSVSSNKKTIYDPCPYGYKVPTNEIQTVLSNNNTNFNQWGAVYNNNDVYAYFPYAGWKGDDVGRVSRTSAWMKVGLAGDYQDARYDESSFHRGRSLITNDDFEVVIYGTHKNSYTEGLNGGYTNRITAASVRCVRYAGEPANN